MVAIIICVQVTRNLNCSDYTKIRKSSGGIWAGKFLDVGIRHTTTSFSIHYFKPIVSD